MKDILVEFTEYGAIIHKDSAKIESLKDMPHCFFNPDLSNVSGVSPSFWSLDESGTIVKASQEEIARRNEHLTSKPAETPSLKTTLDGVKQEILSEIEVRHQEIKQNIDRVKSDYYSISNEINLSLDNKILELIDYVKDLKQKSDDELKTISKQLNVYKLALIVLSIIALIGAIK
jgi:hypothetical protein